jgi:membrane protein implicated in regulation of membrane protease activity
VDGAVAVAVWLVIALVLVGIELLTLAFIALYLATGAVAAAIVGGLGGNVLLQLLALAVVAIGTLVLTRRPLMRLLDRTPIVTSNALTVVGKRAVVTVGIAAGPGHRGQIRVGTEYWSATATGEQAIPEGATVEVVALEGVTAVVRHVP